MWSEEDIGGVNLSPVYSATTQISGSFGKLWKLLPSSRVGKLTSLWDGRVLVSTYSSRLTLKSAVASSSQRRDVSRDERSGRNILTDAWSNLPGACFVRISQHLWSVFGRHTDPRCGLCAVVQPGTLALTRLGHAPLFWSWELWVLLLKRSCLYGLCQMDPWLQATGLF